MVIIVYMKEQVNFIFQSDAKRIFDYFARLFDIRIVFFSSDGSELTAGDDRPRCEYCQLLRGRLGYESTCCKQDRKMQLKASRERKLVSYKCHGGMIEAVKPVFNVDKLIGYIMMGQFRVTNRCPVKLQREWQKRFKNNTLYENFLKAPSYTAKTMSDILGLFSLMVDFIVTRHLIMTKADKPIQKLISYLDDHPETNLSLNDASDMMGTSVSSLSHQFREATGISFKEYLILRKLDTAEQLMKNQTNLKIYELAKIVGYSDPFLFSRIYKKYRGIAPTDFLKLKNISRSF